MSFIIYDVIFLILFTLITALFLYTKRQNLKREGLLYLYRTSIGLKIIDWTSKKFSKILRPMQYLVVTSGYLLMGFMVWALIKLSYVYLTSPTLARELKAPIIFPLIPYLPELFKLDFLPPFYFTYWIIVIAIIAIPHEFAHGIFARLHNIKVHSTGFGFLGPFLAAFVEPDEKQVQKTKNFAQLSILASGTFANVLMTILFGLVFWLFFAMAFTPAGVYFNAYATSPVNISEVSFIDNVTLENLTLVKIVANNQTYFTDQIVINLSKSNASFYILAYDDSPAFAALLSGAITEINGQKINSFDSLKESIQSHSPGDEVIVKTLVGNRKKEVREYNITLSEKDGKAFLGIGIAPPQRSRLLGVFYDQIAKISDPFIYYQSAWGDFGIFIKDLLWWIVLINIGVALTNMLPLGIFDGGRFFYITVFALTKKQKVAEKAFKISTYTLLALVAVLMIKWFIVIFL